MDKKEQILNAAVECFTQYGYSKTTMSDIGRKVGMNKASLYYHFRDKLDLYSAVVSRTRKEHLSHVHRGLAEENTAMGRILFYLKCEIDFTERIALNYLSQGMDGGYSDDETAEVTTRLLEEYTGNLKKLLDEGVESGEFVSCDTTEVAEYLVKIANGILVVDCPLEKPRDQQKAGYDMVRKEVGNVAALILRGLKQ